MTFFDRLRSMYLFLVCQAQKTRVFKNLHVSACELISHSDQGCAPGPRRFYLWQLRVLLERSIISHFGYWNLIERIKHQFKEPITMLEITCWDIICLTPTRFQRVHHKEKHEQKVQINRHTHIKFSHKRENFIMFGVDNYISILMHSYQAKPCTLNRRWILWCMVYIDSSTWFVLHVSECLWQCHVPHKWPSGSLHHEIDSLVLNWHFIRISYISFNSLQMTLPCMVLTRLWYCRCTASLSCNSFCGVGHIIVSHAFSQALQILFRYKPKSFLDFFFLEVNWCVTMT